MWLLILILLLGSEPAFAQQQASPQDAAENTVNQQLNHKIKMIGAIGACSVASHIPASPPAARVRNENKAKTMRRSRSMIRPTIP